LLNPAKKSDSSLSAPAGKRNLIVCLLLAAVTLVLYNPVTQHPFVNYDDDRYVTENPHVRHGLTFETVKWSLTSTEQANWHPLTWMSHALDVSLFRLNPVGHHFTSVLLHSVNVMLLYLILVWSTGRYGPSLFVAAVFAVHPINVESVAWIAERKNLLCTFFFLLTLLAYGWYARKPSWKRYLAVAILFAAGLASKPMVITLPFVLLLLDYWPLDRVAGANADRDNLQRAVPWSKLVLEKLPLFILSAASAIITMLAQESGGAMRSTEQFSFGVRLANAVDAYAMYLWKTVWPARLAPLYPHPGNSLPAWQVFVSVLVLVAISAAAIKFRSRRYLLVGWLWFLGTLVPVIGLVQVGDAAMADRYAYIPLIGVFVMIAFATADVAANREAGRKSGAWLALPAVMVVFGLALATHRQIGYWQTSEDLWSHTQAVTENNFIAEDNLGGALILEGKEEDAHAHFEAASRINPKDPMSRSNLGAYFQTHGRLREAVVQYEKVIELTTDPGLLAQAYGNLGSAKRALGDEEQARKDFAQALQFNPNQSNAWLGLGLIAHHQGKLDEAITDLSRSIELHPTAESYVELGRSLAQSGRRAEALNAYQQALKLDPALTEAHQASDALSGDGR
jgi:protein O-mannosyl-transferase